MTRLEELDPIRVAKNASFDENIEHHAPVTVGVGWTRDFVRAQYRQGVIPERHIHRRKQVQRLYCDTLHALNGVPKRLWRRAAPLFDVVLRQPDDDVEHRTGEDFRHEMGTLIVDDIVHRQFVSGATEVRFVYDLFAELFGN